MEIVISDIPEEGLEVSATEKDAWLLSLVSDVAGEAFDASDSARLSVAMSKFDGNVNLDGLLEFTSHPECDRCLAHFEELSSVLIHTVLSPLHEGHKRDEMKVADEDLVKEDLDFGFYEGDRFDLSDLIREQAILARPMKHLCKLTCLGLCPHCGKDLNEGFCKCEEEEGDPRWAVLKGFKAERKGEGK